MQAYLCIYLNGFNVGKIVSTGRSEEEAKEKALNYLGLTDNCIVAVKLIANFAE